MRRAESVNASVDCREFFVKLLRLRAKERNVVSRRDESVNASVDRTATPSGPDKTGGKGDPNLFVLLRMPPVPYQSVHTGPSVRPPPSPDQTAYSPYQTVHPSDQNKVYPSTLHCLFGDAGKPKTPQGRKTLTPRQAVLAIMAPMPTTPGRPHCHRSRRSIPAGQTQSDRRRF